jgi:hypothetical protein
LEKMIWVSYSIVFVMYASYSCVWPK